MSIAEKLQTIAENEQKVYDTGFSNGRDEGFDLGFEGGKVAGQKTEYDRFWDELQQNGNRTSYDCTFGAGWTDTIFKPKYGINVTSGYMMFRSTNIRDLVNLPVKLDFSKNTNFQYMFQWANTQHVGIFDARATIARMSQTFGYTRYLHTIDKLIFNDNGTTYFEGTFDEALALTNITIEGVIGSSVNFQWSPLSKGSIESVVNALSDNTTGTTITFKKTAVDAAFTTDQWNALVATKPNWTITLV